MNQDLGNHFQIKQSDADGRMIVALSPTFTHEHWDTLSATVRAKVDEGLISWDLDLRRLQLLNSLLMGALIGMNMVLHSKKGELRLILAKDSRVASLIYLAKLNRIINVLEL